MPSSSSRRTPKANHRRWGGTGGGCDQSLRWRAIASPTYGGGRGPDRCAARTVNGRSAFADPDRTIIGRDRTASAKPARPQIRVPRETRLPLLLNALYGVQHETRGCHRAWNGDAARLRRRTDLAAADQRRERCAADPDLRCLGFAGQDRLPGAAWRWLE